MITQVKRDDVVLKVYDQGNTNSEIVVLFLHGGPGSGANALMELDAFVQLETQYHCVYFDQRGSGLSTYDLRSSITQEQIIEDTHAVVTCIKETYPTKKIVVWGGSFGGVVACLYLSKYQDIDKLILSSPAICFGREQSLAFFKRTSSSMKKRMAPYSMSFEEGVTPEEELANEAFQSFVFSTQNPSKSIKHIVAMKDWFFHFDASDSLRNCNIDTLLLIGEDDSICDATTILHSIETLHNEKIETLAIAQCGHAVFVDAKELFLQKIQDFIDR